MSVRDIALHVDSRNRDFQKHPLPSSYVVEIPETLRDVLSVELVYASYTKFCKDDYFILSIAELEPNLVSCSQNSHHAFTQLPLLNDNINTYNSRMQYRSIKRFLQPRASISRLTIKLLLNSGTLAPIKEHVMRFEVRCLVDAPPPDSFAVARSSPPPSPLAVVDTVRTRPVSRPRLAPAPERFVGGGSGEEEGEGRGSGGAPTKKVAAAALVAVGVGAAASYYAYRTFRGGA